MNNRKCFRITAISLVLSILFCNVAMASEGFSKIPHAPDLDDAERIAWIEDTNQEIADYLEAKQLSRSSSARNLSVPLYQQENNYYCGPASVQMAIMYITGTKYSQGTLASYMGTASNGGTYVYQIKNGLNHYVGNNSYQYVLTSEASFANSLVYSVDKGKPVICHVMTGGLPNYNGASNTGHYVLAKGYYIAFSGSNYTSTCVYNDPHFNNVYYGTYTCDISLMQAAINANASYYIRGT